jgi:hypothetical protein
MLVVKVTLFFSYMLSPQSARFGWPQVEICSLFIKECNKTRQLADYALYGRGAGSEVCHTASPLLGDALISTPILLNCEIEGGKHWRAFSGKNGWKRPPDGYFPPQAVTKKRIDEGDK